MPRLIRLIRLFGLLAIAACTSSRSIPSGPADYPPVNFAGSWSGLITIAPGDTGQLILALTQQGGLVLTLPGQGLQYPLAGTWATSFPHAALDDSGVVSGTGYSAYPDITLVLTGHDGCTLTLTGNRTAGVTLLMDGTYASSGCASVDSGAFAISQVTAQSIAGAERATPRGRAGIRFPLP